MTFWGLVRGQENWTTTGVTFELAQNAQESPQVQRLIWIDYNPCQLSDELVAIAVWHKLIEDPIWPLLIYTPTIKPAVRQVNRLLCTVADNLKIFSWRAALSYSVSDKESTFAAKTKTNYARRWHFTFPKTVASVFEVWIVTKRNSRTVLDEVKIAKVIS